MQTKHKVFSDEDCRDVSMQGLLIVTSYLKNKSGYKPFDDSVEKFEKMCRRNIKKYNTEKEGVSYAAH